MSDLGPWAAGDVPHVLYVGDESGCRDGVRSALDAGWALQAADDGIHAMDLLKNSGRPERIVIVLDFSMPVLEGLGFEKARRADPQLAHLPVVLVTVHAADARVKKFGAQAYIQRPITLDVLVETIRHLGREPANG